MKLNKIYEAISFRHWTGGSTILQSQKEVLKWLNNHNTICKEAKTLCHFTLIKCAYTLCYLSNIRLLIVYLLRHIVLAISALERKIFVFVFYMIIMIFPFIFILLPNIFILIPPNKSFMRIAILPVLYSSVPLSNA